MTSLDLKDFIPQKVLRQCRGAIELLDVSGELPQLARRPGLKRWKVRDKGVWLASYEAVPAYRRSVITPGMFPSGKSFKETSENIEETSAQQQFIVNGDSNSEKENHPSMYYDTEKNDSEAEVSDLPLERCMRIVPHDQNSGAFFIAVFRKVSSLTTPAATQKESAQLTEETEHSIPQPQEQMESAIEDLNSVHDSISTSVPQISESNLRRADFLGDEGNGTTPVEHNGAEENDREEEATADAKLVTGKRKLQIQGRWRGVDPIIFYKDGNDVRSMIEFYGIRESFPFKGHLITRNENNAKRIYYVSSSVKEVLELNFLANQQLKIASVGLKMFMHLVTDT
ncbi:hypothetical protein M569_16359 [Genlisea aurea]|uniref:RNA cytosine-C(5)-methyltransferase NSUN2-like pre-PUA domain-containing protein n=1 Tax=Genlisea aurea TaxID=192259 RepID=S8BV54_9LAMI|nr:hypothetical protein M569_16359 [Genlisea aurea]